MVILNQETVYVFIYERRNRPFVKEAEMFPYSQDQLCVFSIQYERNEIIMKSVIENYINRLEHLMMGMCMI